MSENRNKQELNPEKIDQAAGGSLFDDAINTLANLSNSVLIKALQKREKTIAESNNTAAIKKAAKENIPEKTRRQHVDWLK